MKALELDCSLSTNYVASVLGRNCPSFSPSKTTLFTLLSYLKKSPTPFLSHLHKSPTFCTSSQFPQTPQKAKPFKTLSQNAKLKQLSHLVGDITGDKVDALVVCHMDTSGWSSDHVVFRMLGIKHGGALCHVFSQGNLVLIDEPSAIAVSAVEHNATADRLAKSGISRRNSFVWVNMPLADRLGIDFR
ncbi:hypothetical protein V6N13_064552 [Hibiscus sabdariffa]|uniref:BURP domain-containing protein n=1 Tax=Hibiscus sabdariffa TaxID=183260 RepID=A0ABR2EAG4_9ROSI